MKFLMTLLMLLQASTYTPPRLERPELLAPPLNAVGSNWVVLDVEVDSQGRTKSVETLSGQDPYLNIAADSVRRWAFAPRRPSAESHVAVIFLFRSRDIFAGSPVRLAPEIQRRDADRAPFPVELGDPGYPPLSVAEGQTVIEMRIAGSGGVEQMRVVSAPPGLAEQSEQAMEHWKFLPAMQDGKPGAGTAIGVISYLRPVTEFRGQTTRAPN